MTAAHASTAHDPHSDHESHVPLYIKVWGALLVLTVLEYLYAMGTQEHFVALVLGLMALAVTKAVLVAMYFMHLKFEGRWVYFLIVPACTLAAVLVLALCPDIASKKVPLPAGPDDFAATPSPAATTRIV